MTPRQARFALGSFALLAAGVAFNAIYLQGDAVASRRANEAATPPPPADRVRRAEAPPPPRTAPTTTASVPDSKRAAAVKLNSATVDAVPEPSPEQASPETIRAIQRELKQRGHGGLVSDGIMRPATRVAILAYEQQAGLPLTGEASEALLMRILLGASGAPEAGAGAVQSPHAEAVVKQVQRALTAHGYRPGPVDGRLSAETVAAIRVFEMDQGLVPTGRISPGLMAKLAAADAKAVAGR
jgi:peptidoglycan hydrolase-like protein with peptidoglycan-binding domain